MEYYFEYLPQNRIEESENHRPDVINIKVTFQGPNPESGKQKEEVGFISMSNGDHSKERRMKNPCKPVAKSGVTATNEKKRWGRGRKRSEKVKRVLVKKCIVIHIVWTGGDQIINVI